MDSRARFGTGVLLVASLALAAYGQATWAKKPDDMADPLVLFALAGVLLALAVRRATRRPSPLPSLAPARPAAATIPFALPRVATWRAALIAAGVVANLIALALIKDGLKSYAPQVVLWIASWLLFAAGWLGVRGLRAAWAALPGTWRRNRTDILAVLAMTGAALALRLVRLDSVPFTVSGDEGSIGLDMRLALTGVTRNPFAMGFGPWPTMYYQLMAGLTSLLGDSVFVLRLPSAVMGAMAVPALCLLGRELFGRGVGLASAALAVGYHFLLHYSRIGMNSAWGTATVALAVWAFLRGVRRQSPALLGLCALILGLQFHILYPGTSRFAPILVLAIIAWMLLFDRPRLARVAAPVAMAAVLTLLVASPALQFGVRHPGEFNARFNQMGIFQSGWLRAETAVRHQSEAAIVLDQFRLSVMGLFALPDRSAHYGANGPLLGPVMAVFLVLGLGYAMARLRQARSFAAVCWFWGALIGGGVLTLNPPTSNRVVDIIVPLLILTALGLVTAVGFAQRTLRVHPTTAGLVVGLLVVAILFRDLSYYFGEYQRTGIYGGADAQVATRAGYYLRQQPPDTTVLFLGPPRMWFGFSTLPYLAPQVRGVDVEQPVGAGELPAVDGPVAVAIALPGRTAELELIRDRYPGGSIIDFRRLGQNELLFALYELPGGARGR